MTMLFSIARRQRREALGGARGRIFIIFWTALVLLAVWAGAVSALGEQARFEASREAAEAAYSQWLAAYEDDPWRSVYLTAENPILLQKSPAPLRAIGAGVSDLGGSWTIPVGFHLNELDGRKAELSPLGTLLGGLDLTGLIAVVGALAAIALAYDAVSGERERGTLALHFTTPLRRGEFILGKVLGSLQALLMALGIPLLLGAACLFACGAIALTIANLLSMAAFLMLSMIYLACWTAIAVALSAACRTSSVSFVALAGLWLLVAVALPKAALAWADRMAPLPSPVALEQRMSNSLDAAKDFYRSQFGTRQEALGRALNAQELAGLKLAYYEHFFERQAQVLAVHRATVERHAVQFERIAHLSPAFLFQHVASSVAGTDAPTHYSFLSAANRYLSELKIEAEKRLIRGQYDPPSLAELPAFTPAASRSVWPMLLLGLGMLGLQCLLAAAMAWGIFGRYDLRPQVG